MLNQRNGNRVYSLYESNVKSGCRVSNSSHVRQVHRTISGRPQYAPAAHDIFYYFYPGKVASDRRDGLRALDTSRRDP